MKIWGLIYLSDHEGVYFPFLRYLHSLAFLGGVLRTASRIWSGVAGILLAIALMRGRPTFPVFLVILFSFQVDVGYSIHKMARMARGVNIEITLD